MASNDPLRPGQAQAVRDAARRGTLPVRELFDETCALRQTALDLVTRRVELAKAAAVTAPISVEEWRRRVAPSSGPQPSRADG